MRWLLVRIIGLTTVFVLVLFSVRWIGGLSTNPAVTLLGLSTEQVAPSCWHKIWPGRTTFKEAEALLQTDQALLSNIHFTSFKAPYTALCWDDASMPGVLNCAEQYAPSTDVIGALSSVNNTDVFPVRLGDVIALLGTPTASHLCLTLWPEKHLASVALVGTTFAGGNVLIDTFTPDAPLTWGIDPWQKVRVVRIEAAPVALGRDVRWTWRGFVSGPEQPTDCGG